MPNLKKERYNHSSVSLGNYVYVICGKENDDIHLNSVEQLLFRTAEDGEILSMGPYWRLFTLKELTPRTLPLVCSVAPSTLVIYGGSSEVEEEDIKGGVTWDTV